MARDTDKKRRWGDDQEEESDEVTSGGINRSEDYIAKLDELMRRAEPLIEQVNSLYRQYSTGVESRPPIERRKQLEALISSVTMMAKPTAAYRFRFSSLNSSYLSYRDKWDKLVKDVESGKIQRSAGPKK